MDRGRRFQGAPAASPDSDAATKRRPRREVVDTMRRKIELALAVADSAEELATAAQAVLVAAEAEQIVLNNMVLEALRDAVARYREVHGD